MKEEFDGVSNSRYNSSMLAIELIGWWYGQGWIRTVRMLRRRLMRVSQMFSVPILLRTLFAPWRRIMTQPGPGIDAQIRALGDNMISRAVGFVVRLLVLLTASILLLGTMIIGFIELVAWLLLPPMILVAIVMGVRG
jgi:hypothetical protein